MNKIQKIITTEAKEVQFRLFRQIVKMRRGPHYNVVIKFYLEHNIPSPLLAPNLNLSLNVVGNNCDS